MEALHQLGRIALLLSMLLLAALGLFAFTLSQHPIELPKLASWLANQASGSGIRVHVQDAELAWEGYSQGGAVPLVLRVSGIELHSAAGALLVAIPKGDLVVPPSDLFGGREAILLRASAARISGSEAPVTVRARLWPGPGYTLARGTFFVNIGAGTLGRPGASVPVSAASFTMRTAPGMIDVSDGAAALAPVGGSAPVAHFTFTARRAQGWTAVLHVTADAVRAQELGQYWPAPALKGARDWVVTHITAGTARNADFTFRLAAPGDLAGLTLSSATGGFDGQGLTLYWLLDYPPVTALDGHFTMPDMDEAVITATAGTLKGISLTSGRMDITGMTREMQTGALTVQLKGALPDVLALLNTPPLSLLRDAPKLLDGATGQTEGGFSLTFPMVNDLTFDEMQLAVDARVHDLTIPTLGPPIGASQGELRVTSDGQTLQIDGTAQLAGEPATVALNESFAGGGKLDLRLKGAAGPQVWHWLGLDGATAASGPAGGVVPFSLHVTGTATSGQTAALDADLTPAALKLPVFGWAKVAGAPGHLAMTLQLDNGDFTAAQQFSAQAEGLDIEGLQQGNGLTFTAFTIGRTTATGRLTWPTAPGQGWRGDFSGAVLDIRRPQSPAAPTTPANTVPATPPSTPPAASATAPAAPSGPLWRVRLSFDKLYLAPDPAPPLRQLTLAANGRGAAIIAGQAAADGVDLSVTPGDDGVNNVALHAADTGALLRVLDQYQHLSGGTLTLAASYGPGRPFSGTAKLLKARVVDAPDVTKVLEGMTLYGLAEVASGPGLEISDAEIPFSFQDNVLTLRQLRAFSSALGFTASGTIDTMAGTCDIEATVVPLYAVNSLPGKIPLIGRLFAPEKGGGLLAMRAHITGPIDHADVRVNPLSALTPGFLRSIFGLGGALEKKTP